MIPSPPGVFDIVPEDEKEPWRASHLWHFVEDTIVQLAREYGFQEIRTPAFERTELFQRGVGTTSDIVSKEMYTFEDKGKRSMSLRPEGTAPAVRSFIEQQVYNRKIAPYHYFYIGPMFRYERTQAGRYRQHHQFGVEVFGSPSPEQDAELIEMLHTLYQRLGLSKLTIYINSIGDPECRIAFRDALQAYFRPHLSQLSEDSKTRFDTNPLRILDSKDPADIAIVANAPSILDYLSDECKAHFKRVQELLNSVNIPFQINDKLVRGLDYYNRTVFEIVAGELGAQNSIGGGGRYDTLVKMLGGPDMPGCGFGTGIERIIQTMQKQQVKLPDPHKLALFMIPMGEEASTACFKLLHNLRSKGISAQMDFSGKKLAKVMQHADQIGARYIVVIGDQELATGTAELKEMATGNKEKITLDNLIPQLEILLGIKAPIT
jgi:histidyl-tRNA synthetase